MSDLKSAGIEFADYHEGNIMKRDNDFVINDLGLSNSNGQQPDVFEKATKKIAEQLIKEFGGNTQGNTGTSMSMGGLGHYAAGGRSQSSSWSNAQGVRYKGLEDFDEEPLDEDGKPSEQIDAIQSLE